MTFGLGLGFGLGTRSAGAPAGINFDFTTGSLPAGMTFTRAGDGRRFNSSGVRVTETTDVARFDYRRVGGVWVPAGLIVEPARSHTFLRSQEFNNASWIKASMTVTADATTSPDGTANADRLIASAATSEHIAYQLLSASTGTNTIAVFAKPNGYDWIYLFANSSTNACAWFNVTTGALGTISGSAASKTHSIRDCGNGWYLCILTATASAANAASGIGVANGDAVGSFLGDGASGAFVWDANRTNTASYYNELLTTTANVSAAADVASYTIPAGVSTLRYTFDDDTTQDVATSPGAWTIPTNLNRSTIKTIASI